MWRDPRVHLTLETDASNREQLERVQVPEELDIIIDDGSHKFKDQEATLHTLWPRLKPGGFYIVEDMLVGALPWSAEHAEQVPTANSECGHECFFPQRLAEHPFLFDRFGHMKAGSAARRGAALSSASRALLAASDSFWVVTGVHRGGGLDCSLVIRKPGPALGSAREGTRDAGAADALVRAQRALERAQSQQTYLGRQQAQLANSVRVHERSGRRREGGHGCASVAWVLLGASALLNMHQQRQLRRRSRGGP